MFSKQIKLKQNNINYIKSIIFPDDCKVSKASKEIMLHRFFNGKEIEFPFSQ